MCLPAPSPDNRQIKTSNDWSINIPVTILCSNIGTGYSNG